MNEQELAWFWDHIDQSGEPEACWLWTASCKPNGYGQMLIHDDNGKQKNRYVHRIAWEQAHGPIPAGKSVCHHCDCPPCANPAHLFLGSQADNMADAARKERLNQKFTLADVAYIRQHCKYQGDSQKLAEQFAVTARTISQIASGRTRRYETTPPVSTLSYKFPPEQLASLLADYATGRYTQAALADRYNVHYSTVSLLVRGLRRR
jgi:hypothetical protein